VRCIVLALLLAGVSYGDPPKGSADIVIYFKTPQKYKRADWREILRRFRGIAADDTKAIRELGKERYSHSRGSCHGFYYNVPRGSDLKSALDNRPRMQGPPEPESKGAVQLWFKFKSPFEDLAKKMKTRQVRRADFHKSRREKRREHPVSDYTRILSIASELVNDETTGIWFPRRGVYFRRRATMATDALKQALVAEFPLRALGLAKKPEKTERQRLVEAAAQATAEARRRFGDLYQELIDNEHRRHPFRASMFRIAVPAHATKPWLVRWLFLHSATNRSVRTKGGLDYKLDQIVDWAYTDKDGYKKGEFIDEAVWEVWEEIRCEK